MKVGCVVFLVALMLFLPALVLAHKTPLIQYTKIGDVWEAGFTSIPRQPVIGENITLVASVEHPGTIIDGDVNVVFSVFKDDSRHKWYGGSSYKSPQVVLIKKSEGHVIENTHFMTPYKGDVLATNRITFQSDVILDSPGNYQVIIDFYENGQYMGQMNMAGLDVETRTMGPLFSIFLVIIVVGAMAGVRWGVL